MTDWRAVFDTNVLVAAVFSRNAASPTRELLDRRENGEFTLLTCQQLAEELAEKYLARGRGKAGVA